MTGYAPSSPVKPLLCVGSSLSTGPRPTTSWRRWRRSGDGRTGRWWPRRIPKRRSGRSRRWSVTSSRSRSREARSRSRPVVRHRSFPCTPRWSGRPAPGVPRSSSSTTPPHRCATAGPVASCDGSTGSPFSPTARRCCRQPGSPRATTGCSRWADLWLCDHGFAGAALRSGGRIAAFVDFDTIALAVASTRVGAGQAVVVPLDDQRPPLAYQVLIDLVSRRIVYNSGQVA